MQNMLSFFVIAPIITAIFLFTFPFIKAGRVIAIAAQSAILGFAIYLFLLCRDGQIITDIGGFGDFLGITLMSDTMSSSFVVLTAFLFLIATIYSFNEKDSKLFWFLIFIWEGLLIGIFLTRDLFNLFVLIEVTVVTVSVLIMFKRDSRSMYDGMLYLMVSTVVAQFFLFGVGYIYKITGVFDIDAATKILAETDKSSLVLPYALIMTALSLKCALIPLFSWLPRAHGTASAPPAASAIMSGLHVKCSVYLFIRFSAVFGGIDMSELFLIIGIITGIAGFIFALSQTDIKLILAYHTISQIGMIMIGLNLPDEYSYIGSLYHIFNHALFKSALFLCAGLIIDIYGTRRIDEIRGVLRRMPIIGAATIMGILGITGTPLFNGSISKYFISSGADSLVSYAVILINLGTIVSFIKYSTILFGKPSDEVQKSTAKPDIFKQSAVLILGVLCFAGGILGEQIIKILFNAEVSVSAVGYLEKSAVFLASVIAGFLIYKYYVTRSRLFARIRGVRLNFRGICVSIGAFFAVLLLTVNAF